MRQDLIEIAKFGRAHGTRGEIRLWCHNPESPLFERDRLVGSARDASGALRDVTITSLRWADKFAIVKVQGARHREDVEELINQRLLIPREEFEAPNEDEIYLVDTIGWPVWVEQGERYYEVGELKGFVETGAYSLMRVTLHQGGSWLVPMLDHCIIEMRQERERVVLAPLDEWAVEGEELPTYRATEQAPRSEEE